MGKKVNQKQYEVSGKYPVIDQGKEDCSGYCNDEEKVIDANFPILVFGDHTRAVKSINNPFVAGADGVKVLQPSGAITPKLLFYFTQYLAISIKDKGYARHYQWVAKELIGIPPENEQIRIVEKIEELFSELDKGIESLKTAKAQLAVYRQALLKHAFEGKLTEEWRKDNADKLESPEQLLQHIQQEREARYQQQLDDWKQEIEKWEADGKGGKKPQKPRKAQIKQTEALVDDLPNEWAVYSLSEISEHIVDGTHKTPKYVSEGVKFISAKDIFGFRISFENTRFITEEEHKELIKRCNPKKGNVLITKSGTLGRVAVVKDESEFSLFESVANVPVLPPMISEFVSKQVYYVINTGFGASIQKGVAVRHLHLEDLRKLPLSICSVEEQQEICLRLDSEFTLLDSLERELEVNLRKCEVLRQSILKKAFSGQLVSQDPNDEPASELLKKIAIEKAELAEKEKAEKAAARKVKAAKKAKT